MDLLDEIPAMRLLKSAFANLFTYPGAPYTHETS
jgi:hypothetical protein